MKNFVVLLLGTVLSLSSYSQNFLKQSYPEDKLHTFVVKWWSTPYRYGGTTKKGIDCSAFTGKLYKEVYNTPLPRTASQQFKASKIIPKSQLKDGDLVFFRTNVKSGWHVGVYLVDGWFIHSASRQGVKVSNLKDPKYSRIFYRAGRIIFG